MVSRSASVTARRNKNNISKDNVDSDSSTVAAHAADYMNASPSVSVSASAPPTFDTAANENTTSTTTKTNNNYDKNITSNKNKYKNNSNNNNAPKINTISNSNNYNDNLAITACVSPYLPAFASTTKSRCDGAWSYPAGFRPASNSAVHTANNDEDDKTNYRNNTTTTKNINDARPPHATPIADKTWNFVLASAARPPYATPTADRYYDGDKTRGKITPGTGKTATEVDTPARLSLSLSLRPKLAGVRRRLRHQEQVSLRRPKKVVIGNRHFKNMLELREIINIININSNTNYASASDSTLRNTNASYGSTPNNSYGSASSSALTSAALLPANRRLPATVFRQV